MSLTGKTIGQLTYLSGVTNDTLFPVELSGDTYQLSYSAFTSNYTIYKILLTLSSGTFTVNQLENTIGDGSNTSPNDIEWTNPSNGTLRATKSGAFTSSNIAIQVSNINASGVLYVCTGQKSTSNFITFDIWLHDGTKSSTPNFSNLPIEIRIYN